MAKYVPKSPSGSKPSSDPAAATGGATKAQSKSVARAEALAQLQKEQARRRRSSRLFLATGVVGAVVLLVVVVVAVGLSVNKGHSKKGGVATASVVNKVTKISAATFDTVGAGTADAFPPATGAPALTAGGLPRFVYVGAEYCPFCAAQRWAVTAALSRFGTFSGLGETFSAPSPEVYPDTATLSFHGATYTSKYLSFTGVEQTDQDHKPLDTLSEDDSKLIDTYDVTKYTGVDSGGIPFVDVGGSYVTSGSSYDPTILKGLTQEEIATEMNDPSTDIGKAVLGTANEYTAAICKLTQDQPSAVCSSAGVTAAAADLK